MKVRSEIMIVPEAESEVVKKFVADVEASALAQALLRLHPAELVVDVVDGKCVLSAETTNSETGTKVTRDGDTFGAVVRSREAAAFLRGWGAAMDSKGTAKPCDNDTANPVRTTTIVIGIENGVERTMVLREVVQGKLAWDMGDESPPLQELTPAQTIAVLDEVCRWLALGWGHGTVYRYGVVIKWRRT